jgi:hypothetical protein
VAPRSLARRLGEGFGVAVALAAFFVAGDWLGPRVLPASIRPRPNAFGGITIEAMAAQENVPEGYDPTKGIPTPEERRHDDDRSPDRRAVEARSAAIRHDILAIQEEARQHGGWEKWQAETKSCRENLKARLDAPIEQPPAELTRYHAPLEGLNDFPLFEIDPRFRINHLYEPEAFDKFRKEQPVAVVTRWLRQKGIDLIFVPVPKMTEIYIEHFIDPCPGDGVIAPHLRRILLELLERDVEVVDGFPLFRARRDDGREYLYNAVDTHWSPRGTRVMAKALADRIERYRWAAQSRYDLPIAHTYVAEYVFPEFIRGYNLLTPRQGERARKVQTTNFSQVVMNGGGLPPDDPKSPVILIGHSYVRDLKSQLVKELNMRIHSVASDESTTEAFADFLREPELLAHTRVIVWITTEQHMSHFKPLPPL